MWTAQATGLPAAPSGGVGRAPPAAPGADTPRQAPCSSPFAPRAENKLEKSEEAALLSWETYLKEIYLQSLQSRQRQRLEHRVQHVSDRCWWPGSPLGRVPCPRRVQGTVRTWPTQGRPSKWSPQAGEPRRSTARGRALHPAHGPPSESWEGRLCWPREAPWGGVAGALDDGQLGPQEANWEPGGWTVSVRATAL